MRRLSMSGLLLIALTVWSLAMVGCGDDGLTAPVDDPVPSGENVVLRWDEATLQAIRDTKPGPPMTARALAIVHTCIYDAWAAYDDVAVGTRFGPDVRRPEGERTPGHQSKAISYAAYRALDRSLPLREAGCRSADDRARLRSGRRLARSRDSRPASGTAARPRSWRCATRTEPTSSAIYAGRVRGLHRLRRHEPADRGRDAEHARADPAPRSLAAAHLREPRRADGHAELHRAPLGARDPVRADLDEPVPAGPAGRAGHAGVRHAVRRAGPVEREPDRSGEVHRRVLGGRSGLRASARSLGASSRSSSPAATTTRWTRTSRCSSRWPTPSSTAASPCWDAKRFYDYARPVTAIRYLYNGQIDPRLGRPGAGQRAHRRRGLEAVPADLVPHAAVPRVHVRSQHLQRGGRRDAEALHRQRRLRVLARRTARDRSRRSRGSRRTPTWPSPTPRFTEAADAAAISRRLGGIHFRDGDLNARAMGRRVGIQVYQRAESYWLGYGAPMRLPMESPQEIMLALR